MNRAPGVHDRWWKDHESSCGGIYTKIKEPEGYGQKKGAKRKKENEHEHDKDQKDIRSFIKSSKISTPDTTAKENGSSTSKEPSKGTGGNIFGFGGPSYASPSVSGFKTKGTKSSIFTCNGKVPVEKCFI